jgi:hypothetical protein
MDAQKFRSFSTRFRALLAVAVLLDGREAAAHLELDATHGEALKKAALDLAAMETDLRMPLLGTTLRAALDEMQTQGKGRL